MQLHSDSLSDIGKQRKKNEDFCFADPQAGLFIVADGMGGHPAGEIASRMAVDFIAKHLQQALPLVTATESIHDLIETGCQQTSQAIYRAGLDNPDWRGMGTTLALACCQGQRAYLANVGDSRIYLLRGGILKQCSQDHTLGSRQQVPAEQQSMLHHILTQAIGLEQRLEVHQQQFDLENGDRLLLCSDGLTNMLSDTDISRLLSLPREPRQVCRQLVAAANDRGGRDNISVVVVSIAAI